MEVKASLRNIQTAPRKVRLVADLIRGASVSDAKAQLQLSTKKVAKPMMKLVDSAIANATHNHSLNPDTLTIKSIRVDHGRTLKRYRPRAFGRAGLIRKRASHIFLVLEGEEMAKPKKAAPKSAKGGSASGGKATPKKTVAKPEVVEKDMEKQPPKKKEGKKAPSKKAKEKGGETKNKK
jgi:large subunit ribosomal protein L22